MYSLSVIWWYLNKFSFSENSWSVQLEMSNSIVCTSRLCNTMPSSPISITALNQFMYYVTSRSSSSFDFIQHRTRQTWCPYPTLTPISLVISWMAEMLSSPLHGRNIMNSHLSGEPNFPPWHYSMSSTTREGTTLCILATIAKPRLRPATIAQFVM